MMARIVAGNFQPFAGLIPYLSAYENSEAPFEFMCTDYPEK
jgi:hypothetical protein